MEFLPDLLGGFATVLTPTGLLYAFLGVLIGSAVGVLPGIGPAMTIALLLPVAYALGPTSAFIMFAGIYYGGMFGGAITSILLNTPGESASVITAMEGNLMARRGRAAQALAAAVIGSFIAGTVGSALLVLVAPIVVRFAVQLGAADYLAIMLLAFVSVTAVLGSSRIRGFASLGIGLAIGLIGLDSITGQSRLTFGVPQLAEGIDVVVVAVGIFAVGEALWVAAHLRRNSARPIPLGRPWLSKADLKRCWKPWLRGIGWGFPFGTLPAGGAEIPTFLSYVTEKRLAKHDEFGKGAIEGVAGPEATNNASAAGSLVPILTLGLPANATGAVLLAAFTQFGIQPGPLLFERESELVWALIASLFVGNVLLLVLNLPLAPVWAKLLQIPRPLLYAGILFFATLGAYSVNAQTIDLLILLALGLLGVMMRRYGLPVLPAIVGVILGPRAELQMRRTFQLSNGEFGGLWDSWLAITIYVIIAAILLAPLVLRLTRKQPPTLGGELPGGAGTPVTPSEAAAGSGTGGVPGLEDDDSTGRGPGDAGAAAGADTVSAGGGRSRPPEGRKPDRP